MLSIVRFAPHQLTCRCSCSHGGYNEKQLEKDINQLQFKCYEKEFTAKHISPECRSTDTFTFVVRERTNHIEQNLTVTSCTDIRFSPYVGGRFSCSFHRLHQFAPTGHNPGRSTVVFRSDCAYAVHQHMD